MDNQAGQVNQAGDASGILEREENPDSSEYFNAARKEVFSWMELAMASFLALSLLILYDQLGIPLVISIIPFIVLDVKLITWNSIQAIRETE